MNTAYYTLSTWGGGAMAAGFDGTADAGRRSALVRQGGRARGGDNVIDLNAWRAANLEAWADGEAYAAAEGAEAEEPELSVPAPRPRKSRRAALLAEAASTVCVAAAALAIILRVVAF
ncbi:MAG: hypothetical protein HFF25_06720 [Oscillospiraceae bacterium]|jgi:hypothetical protein|nr:hypothetical protein [Oscillospiraceae bacterium]MCI9551228.1 hypothetical protein [Oscillospiraceae bacterium]